MPESSNDFLTILTTDEYRLMKNAGSVFIEEIRLLEDIIQTLKQMILRAAKKLADQGCDEEVVRLHDELKRLDETWRQGEEMLEDLSARLAAEHRK
jgi:uncharacterized protein (UPF0335 family)